jgi:hypothetical protein
MQIPALPSFSMTDYSAQGKTRTHNVVNIQKCRDFQGAYTCLSRGTSLAGTLILRDFTNNKVAGVLDGQLRQEYRELNYLDAIIKLRYEGKLPVGVVQNTRNATIRAYRQWAPDDVAQLWHERLRDGSDDIIEDSPNEFSVIPSTMAAKKHKRPHNGEEPGPSRASKRQKAMVMRSIALVNSSWAAPIGPVWDNVDWSCAYDGWMNILHWLWAVEDKRLVEDLARHRPALQTLVDGFRNMQIEQGEMDITSVRDRCQETVRAMHPGEYPVGRQGADIRTLSQDLLGLQGDTDATITQCSVCHVCEER